MYPCGFPLILALYYLLTGAALHTAIYLVLAFSLASIVLAYLFARSVFGFPTALLAALFLSVAPSYVGYSQVLISDMVSNTFMIAGLWLAWMAAVGERKTSRLWFAAGALCGFSTAVHIMRIITLLPLCATCLIGSRRNIRCHAISLAYLVAGFVVGISPVLMYNGMAFGDIFKTGYYYWERWEGGKDYFSLHYAIRNTAVSERGDQRGNIVYYLWHFFGLSWPTLFAPYFFGALMLALFGAAYCSAGVRRSNRFFRRAVLSSLAACALAVWLLISSGTAPAELPWIYAVCLLAAGVTAVLLPWDGLPVRGEEASRGISTFSRMSVLLIVATVLMLFFYSFQMAKFFLPVVPFICVLAAYGIVMLVRECSGVGIRRLLLRIPVAILLAVTAWGCAKPFAGGDLRHHAPTWWYEGFRVLNPIAPDDAFLISGIDGVYVTHYFIRGTHRTYMPISREVEYIRQRDLPLKVAMENPGYIRSLLASGKRVYMDGFTFNWWARYRAALEKDFSFVPVTSYYNGSLRLYELRPKSTS
jgi:4-amino-4-deoxy-L-arabinose transferase-like glycosyltransferase